MAVTLSSKSKQNETTNSHDTDSQNEKNIQIKQQESFTESITKNIRPLAAGRLALKTLSLIIGFTILTATALMKNKVALKNALSFIKFVKVSIAFVSLLVYLTMSLPELINYQESSRSLDSELKASKNKIQMLTQDIENSKQQIWEFQKAKTNKDDLDNDDYEEDYFQEKENLAKLTSSLKGLRRNTSALAAKYTKKKLSFRSLVVDLSTSALSLCLSVAALLSSSRVLLFTSIATSIIAASSDFVSSLLGKLQHERLASLEDPNQKVASKYESAFKTFVSIGALAILVATIVESTFSLQNITPPTIGAVSIFLVIDCLILGFDVITKIPALTLEDVDAVQQFSALAPDLG